MTDFDTIVVGNGLIGSAAARYLSELGRQVALIGQSEPADASTHDGVFSSHYDQRRLTHVTGKRTDAWVKVKQLAVQSYRKLEEESGISFYDPVGFIMTLPAEYRDQIESPRNTAVQCNISHRYFPVGDRSWRDEFPEYDFPGSHAILYEPLAGAIDPRAMRQAQNVVAEAFGTTIVDLLVTDVRREDGLWLVSTREGKAFSARKVLLATGAFTNSYDLLERKLALTPKTEVVCLGEVSADDGPRLSQLPTLNYNLDDPEIMEGYLTPAAKDKSGRYFVKFGANSIYDKFGDDLKMLQKWFRNGDSDALLPAMKRTLKSIMPDTHFLSFTTKRCVITRTANTYPMIDEIEDGLFVAGGGNGGSAQCAGVWGKLAAEYVHANEWVSDIPHSILRAVFKP